MGKLIDLNCDMGEGFGHWTLGEAPDEDLMALISSANVAAGFHAGDHRVTNGPRAELRGREPLRGSLRLELAAAKTPMPREGKRLRLLL